MKESDRRFSVAPMLDWTDRHCRYFHRLFSRHAFLYTEMVTTGAILHGDAARHLDFNDAEHPVALQLGGSNPAELAACTKIAWQWGYDEVNLNVGCPSDRVQNGRFGACLMAEPALVRDCLAAMRDAAPVPITVKHRIGIDDQESYEFLADFVATVAQSGVRTFIVHARKAILSGLSPKQNREIPPLDYERVYRLKRDFPELEIIINGGIRTLGECRDHLRQVDGVMVGREAYQNPQILAGVDSLIYGDGRGETALDKVIEGLLEYAAAQLNAGARLGWIARHLTGLFQGCPGARAFRRHLSEHAFREGAGIEVLHEALAKVNWRAESAA